MPKVNLVLKAIVQDIEQQSMYLWIQKGNETKTNLIVPLATKNRPSELRDKIDNRFGCLPTEKVKADRIVKSEILDKISSAETIKATIQTGWKDSAFILPYITIGSQKIRTIHKQRFVGEANGKSTAGTLKEWKDAFQSLCKQSNYAVFSFATAMAGPALKLIDEKESLGVNNVGDSSCGKTILNIIAKSIFERSRRAELPTFSHTRRGFEELAAERNDMFLPIDELGQIDCSDGELTKRTKAFALLISGGKGMQRSKSLDATLPNLNWQLSFLTTSNQPVADHEGSNDRRSPTEVRWPDIVIPSVDEGGVVDRGTSGVNATKNAALLKAAENKAEQFYGTVGKAWIKHLVSQKSEATKKLMSRKAKFMETYAKGFNSQDIRIAQKFAVIYAVADVAAEIGIVPWTAVEGRNAVVRIFKRYRSTINAATQADVDTLNSLARIIGKDSIPRYEYRTKIESMKPDSVFGFVRESKSGNSNVYLFTDRVEQLEKKLSIAKGRIVKILFNNNLLSLDSDGDRTKPTKTPWKVGTTDRPRMYVIPLNDLRRVAKTVTKTESIPT